MPAVTIFPCLVRLHPFTHILDTQWIGKVREDVEMNEEEIGGRTYLSTVNSSHLRPSGVRETGGNGKDNVVTDQNESFSPFTHYT